MGDLKAAEEEETKGRRRAETHSARCPRDGQEGEVGAEGGSDDLPAVGLKREELEERGGEGTDEAGAVQKSLRLLRRRERRPLVEMTLSGEDETRRVLPTEELDGREEGSSDDLRETHSRGEVKRGATH